MKCSAVILILILNTVYTFSQIAHEILTIVSCFDNGTTEMQVEVDSNELGYVDFERQDIVFTVPRFLVPDPRQTFAFIGEYKDIIRGKTTCLTVLGYCAVEEQTLPENWDPPDSVIYPAEEVQLKVENSLICFVNHFYPPSIRVSWTKNGLPVSEKASLSRYYPDKDHTFYQFSTLTFTPSEGDIYSCTVEHPALESPVTRIWEPDINHPSLGPDIFCGVGLALGVLGIAVGTFLIVKGHHVN
uniref:Ig-like domain-containing protein n=1 Tax=Monopterus albus TaxID=43700 RepID=A0A3Q3IHS5_MONAL|nr:H-2 class II histocompatibility antigen, A-U alpha chain-like [Monopterus albus]